MPPEEALRFMAVMPLAPNRQVLNGGLAAGRERDDVMELQKGPLPAYPAARADEAAASVIALPDFASHRRGDVPAVRARSAGA
jgi:hypothetical protein